MSNNKDNGEGVRARVTRRVLEATSDDDLKRIRQELKAEGEKEGSINAIVSELRKRGLLKFGESGEPTSAAVVKRQQSPLEVLIRDLELPTLVDGQAEVFDAGVHYGIRSVLVGVRVAQELSAMGVQQATPIIQMAKEMRQAEGQAAEVIAAELAQATLESNREIIAAIRSQAIAQSPNPMLAMMTQAMQPMLQQAMGSLMGMFQPKQLPPGTQPAQPGQQPPVSGFQAMTDEERGEVFGHDDAQSR